MDVAVAGVHVQRDEHPAAQHVLLQFADGGADAGGGGKKKKKDCKRKLLKTSLLSH
ncbi:hypothetical protein [Pseudomonas sp. MWU12-2323]|uniref:hypothetical protein n=1 Tax=Pseudomonas sp. MWU12-2323 TaxID=2651296 RepID=UPI0015B78181|nr:hypothetical protein [Pseudomonas sp. MWU12-2323]